MDAPLHGTGQSDPTPNQPRHRGRERGLRETMGQKTHPTGFRLGIIKSWSSKWYEEKNFAKWLHEDIRLKNFIKEKLEHAGVAGVDVERAANKAKINIYTARPGIVIGKRGAGVEQLKKEVQAL